VSYAPITVAARRVLLDALEALEEHREGLVLVGAQAIYLYTGDADVAIATTTKDSGIALIPIRLAPEPTLDAAMTASGFSHDRWSSSPASGRRVRRSTRPSSCSCPKDSTRAADVAALGFPRTPSTRRALCPVSKPRE
jgi:hypothetical protein